MDFLCLMPGGLICIDGFIDKIWFPSTDKVGEEASEAAWLIIQHSIGRPKFTRRYSQIVESLMQVEKKYHRYYAYLTDRIAVFENSPQRYGTQFDWDEYGELNPNRKERFFLESLWISIYVTAYFWTYLLRRLREEQKSGMCQDLGKI